MPSAPKLDAALCTERVLPFSPERVYAAFAAPEQLATWWGPQGFTNTFTTFEFEPGGRWVFTMHGPNGATYPNECLFLELVPGAKLALEHVVAPWFRLFVTLVAQGDGTHLTWVQEFESSEVAAMMKQAIGNANEENLDRLQALLAEVAG